MQVFTQVTTQGGRQYQVVVLIWVPSVFVILLEGGILVDNVGSDPPLSLLAHGVLSHPHRSCPGLMMTGCLCLAGPTPAVSAQANGYLWIHGCHHSHKTGAGDPNAHRGQAAMVSEGLGAKSLYSSLKARDKTCIGCPSPSVTVILPGSK